MDAPKRPPLRPARPPRKTPAERGEEFATEQRKLKQEAAERRAAAKGDGDRPEAGPEPHTEE
jgi:hypothetical protein